MCKCGQEQATRERRILKVTRPPGGSTDFMPWRTLKLTHPVPILRFKVRSTDAWRARRARAYNGGLGAEPPAGSRGRAPGQGVRGAKPPEAESLLAFQRPITARKITPVTVSSKLMVCDVSSTFNRIPNISLLKTG